MSGLLGLIRFFSRIERKLNEGVDILTLPATLQQERDLFRMIPGSTTRGDAELKISLSTLKDAGWKG